MSIPDEQKRRDDLIELLCSLAESQDVFSNKKERRDIFLKLEKIYYIPDSNQCFRHYYSDIFATLTQIDSGKDGSLEILAQNMQSIKDGYKPINKDSDGNLIDIGKSINKLYDHTNLEIARINYTRMINNDTKSELTKTRMLFTNLDKQVKEVNEKNEGFEKKLKNESDIAKKEIEDNHKTMQNEYVTILGIFAAIVLAFTGSLTFSSSVLNNIRNSSAHKLCVIAFIIGIVFFNIVWALLDFIRDINSKPVHRKWLFIVVNTIFIGGIVFTCFAYKFQWFVP